MDEVLRAGIPRIAPHLGEQEVSLLADLGKLSWNRTLKVVCAQGQWFESC